MTGVYFKSPGKMEANGGVTQMPVHKQLSTDSHSQALPDVTPRHGGGTSHCRMADVTCIQSHPTPGNADVPLPNHSMHPETEAGWRAGVEEGSGKDIWKLVEAFRGEASSSG